MFPPTQDIQGLIYLCRNACHIAHGGREESGIPECNVGASWNQLALPDILRDWFREDLDLS